MEFDEHLSGWKEDIISAQKEQAKHRRMAKYSSISLGQVKKVLHNGVPVNAADLVGLTLNTLEQLADRIRNDPNNLWHHYWECNQNPRKFSKPKHENDCRDTLLFR